MIKTIDVAGITLDDGSVRDMLTELERDMSEQGFRAIEEVNAGTLMLADEDDSVRQMLGLLDHTVICETGILEAIGEGSGHRRREIERHDFFHALMREIERSQRTLCLIAEEQGMAESMAAYIGEHYPRCEVIESQTLEGWDGVADSVVNEINAASPDVILSILPSPMQEQFLLANRDKFSAGLWYGIGALRAIGQKGLIRQLVWHFIRVHRLEKKIHTYQAGK